MKRKIISFLLAAMITTLSFSSPVMASTVSQEITMDTDENESILPQPSNPNLVTIGLVDYRYLPDKDAYEVSHIESEYDKVPSGTLIELESEINGKPVISISSYTIADPEEEIDMASVIVKLPESIKRIEDGAFFWACVNVIFNNSLNYIGNYAFYDSFVGTTELTIPGNVRYIGKESFVGSTVQVLHLEDGVQEIGACAFGDCNLKKVYIPNSVTKIGKDAFFARDILVLPWWNLSNIKPTIYCETNSTAHHYALKNNYPYKLYDTTNEIPATTLTRKATHYNGATLKWKSLSNVDGYRIYRSTTGKDGSWTALKNVSGKSTTTYRDTTAKIGKTYYYTVKGYKKAGKYKKYGNFKSNIVKATPYLKTPTVTKVSSRTAQFQWNKVSGATGYQLWRSNSPDGLYKRIQVSKTTSAKDTTAKKGKTYYYKIRAYRKANDKYVYSKCTDVRKLTIK